MRKTVMLECLYKPFYINKPQTLERNMMLFSMSRSLQFKILVTESLHLSVVLCKFWCALFLYVELRAPFFCTIQKFTGFNLAPLAIFCLPYSPHEPLRVCVNFYLDHKAFDSKDEMRTCCCFFCPSFYITFFNLFLVSRTRFIFPIVA